MGEKRGQVTIFIIIAVLVVASIAAYFLLRGTTSSANVPASLEPVYTSFLACVQEDLSTGIKLLESQGGYIDQPDFQPGSSYMPFSSQLNFLGNQVPYWYYVSGNGIPKNQVPTKAEMESQIAEFISQKARDCSFESYYSQGFQISIGESRATASIGDSSVSVDLKTDLSLSLADESVVVKDHKVVVDSTLGTLYQSAKKVYDSEQKNLFLEKYAVDSLRLYAPVDGVEVTCSPLTWNANDIFDDLQNALEATTSTLKSSGDTTEYSVIKPSLDVKENVRFLTSKNWPHVFEVNPSNGPLLISTPIGNQQGLGVLGFCYVPYHFVYDMKYPVMVQVSSGNEIFQFPVAVVIQGNNARTALNATAVDQTDPELCTSKNTEIQVNTKDKLGLAVEADVSYECGGNSCYIGKSDTGRIKSDFPQCINGYVLASASGFKDAKYLFSTTKSGSVDVILEKLYTSSVQLSIDGANYNGNAIVNFVSGDDTKTISYPEQRSVDLAEGQYEVQVYIYKNSSITFGATTAHQCVTVPKAGILSVFGLTQEKCFDIQVPSQVVSDVLAGGGKQSYYFLENQLIKSGIIEIDSHGFETPKTQTNFKTIMLYSMSKDWT